MNPWESFRKEMRVLEISIDRELPDEMFRMEFQEGAQVRDERCCPPLIYKYTKDRSDEARAKRDRDALIGPRAPALPKTGWINSETLTWEALAGRPVILWFFNQGRGDRSERDVPTAATIHRESGKQGALIVGIHCAGWPREAVEEFVNEFEVDYPVCLDEETETVSLGKTFEAYRVESIPVAVLVDGEGKVARYGSLGEMMGRAGEMVRGGI